ncbi:MAG: RusA family crossover junction endodeoxyribonuclease [Polyangiaceae bacterium]
MRMFSASTQETAYRELVALAAPHAPPSPFLGPLAVSLGFFLQIAAGWPEWKKAAARADLVRPTGRRGDLDNLAKQVLDALGRSGQWFRDDGQVVSCALSKRFADRPRIAVRIEGMPHVASAAEWRARAEGGA